jgi:Amt family ammonium transporter
VAGSVSELREMLHDPTPAPDRLPPIAAGMAHAIADDDLLGRNLIGIVTGMVAGLGTITPASGFVGPGGALVIGLLAGTVCFFMTMMVKRVWKIDDSLDVFPVHGVGGILGTLLVGVFASPHLGVFSGLGFSDAVDGMSGQLWVQFLGVVITVGYTALITFAVLKVTGVLTAGLRATREEELIGLDISMHEEEGYKL